MSKIKTFFKDVLKIIPDVLVDKIDRSVSNNLTIMQSATQLCSAKASNLQNLTIVGQVGNIDITNLDFSQFASVDLNCLQVTQASNVASQIAAEAAASSSDLANAVLEAFPKTKNTILGQIERNSVNLHTLISDSFSQVCVPSAQNEQAIFINNGVGTVTLSYINLQQSASSIGKCAQAGANETEEAKQLWKAIDSAALNETLEKFRDFNWAILAGMGLAFVVLLAVLRVKVLLSPVFYFAVSATVFLFLSVSHVYKGWPYAHTTEHQTLLPDLRPEENPDAAANGLMLTVFIIATVICCIGLVISILFYSSEVAWKNAFVERRTAINTKTTKKSEK